MRISRQPLLAPRLRVGPFAGFLVAALALAWGVPGTAEACSVCGCGNPLVDVASSEPMPQSLRLALGFQYLTATAQSDDEPTRTEALEQMTLTPMAVYSPIDRLNLVLRVPLERKAWRLTGGNVAEERSTQYGLGDLDLGARYFLWEHVSWAHMSRQDLALFAGSTLPTGPNGTTVAGVRIDDHAQLGTGAFGMYAGMQYAFHRNPWNLFASVSGQVHSTSSYGYQYAPALLWAVRGTVQPWPWLAGELGIDGRENGHDTADGDAQVNTGGLLLSLSPGTLVRIADGLWVHLWVQIPVIDALNGVQSVGPVFNAQVQYSFD